MVKLNKSINFNQINKDKSKWYKLLSRDGVDITTLSQIDIAFYDIIWQATKKQEEVFFTILKEKKFAHYIGVNPESIEKFSFQKYFNTRKKIEKHHQRGRKILNEIKENTSKWEKELSKNFTYENLIFAFKDFRKNFEEINYIYSIISWLGIESWQRDFEDILNEMISRNKFKSQTEKILYTVYKSWKKTALIELQEKLALGVNPKKLVDEYQFLRSFSAIWHKPITEDWVNSIKVPKQKKKLNAFSSKKILDLLKPNTQEKIFLDLAPYIIFFKDWRDDVRRFQVFQWSFLFDKIAEKFEIPRNDVGYLTLDEIETFLKKKSVNRKAIKQRKNGCVITIAKQGLKMQVLDKKIKEKYYSIAKQINQRKQGKIVRGKIAQPGIVKGMVKIVKSYHDIKHVQKGDILVANTTHPNYLPAMQKAVGFVTNEGGIISHAAIVAREMKKPCLVGTGNATKILMHGDYVKVDANKGIITIVKK
ncbi:hypothetical protein KKG58_01850 [Patescibacteria group bacterium]|nr:hypothetical protein [Patescibacteria group bacterium]